MVDGSGSEGGGGEGEEEEEEEGYLQGWGGGRGGGGDWIQGGEGEREGGERKITRFNRLFCTVAAAQVTAADARLHAPATSAMKCTSSTHKVLYWHGVITRNWREKSLRVTRSIERCLGGSGGGQTVQRSVEEGWSSHLQIPELIKVLHIFTG